MSKLSRNDLEFSAWCLVPRRPKFLPRTNVLSAALTARVKVRIRGKPGNSSNDGMITKIHFLVQMWYSLQTAAHFVDKFLQCSFLGAHKARKMCGRLCGDGVSVSMRRNEA